MLSNLQLPNTRTALAGAALLLAASCSGESSTGYTTTDRDVTVAPVLYDLVGEFEDAERWGPALEFQPGSYAARRHMSEGWDMPRDDQKAALWSDDNDAVVTFLLPEVGPLNLKTQTSALVKEGETSHTELFLNGERIGEYELTKEWMQLDVDLPEEHQREGLNRLHFRFEHCRTRHAVEGADPASHKKSARFTKFRFAPKSKVRKRWEWMNRMAPEGIRTRTLPEGPGVLEQVSSSILRYYLIVPPGARFATKLKYAAALNPRPENARFSVTLIPDDAEPVTLVDELVPWDAPATDVDVALDAYSGQVALLELRVEAPGGAAEGTLLGGWIGPRLTLSPDALPAPGGAAAADCGEELRTDLAGAPVVMVLIDACNPSFLSCYGGREGLTPHIDRMAKEGVLFPSAYSIASYTVASVSSMLTSRYSWEHGTWAPMSKLGLDFPVWTERFRDAGYRTAGVVHSINGSSERGFERGFEEYVEVFRDRKKKRFVPMAEETIPEIGRILAADDGRPLFLWLHIVEPHRPYTPPAPYAGRYSDGIDSDLDGTADSAYKIKRHLYLATDDDMAYMKAIYEENLAYVDDILGRVRTQLEEAGMFDEAIVCIFSDHGEGFLDHEGKPGPGLGHGETTYDDMTRIPLIFRLPEGKAPAGSESRALISGLDIFPTIAELAGVSEVPQGHGVSFAQALCDPEADVRRHVISHANSVRTNRFFSMWGHWWEDYKLVYHPGDAPKLYDLSADPGELRNLCNERPVLCGYLRQELGKLTGINIETGEVKESFVHGAELDDALIEQLEALGYAR
ncbi:MAG: sulfatase [Planctomycetota bacterium]